MSKQVEPVHIMEYIKHHAAGGTYCMSRAVFWMLSSDPVAGQQAVERERTDQAMGALRHAKRLLRQRFGNSKYVPHQGKREKERRRIGGFHTLHA